MEGGKLGWSPPTAMDDMMTPHNPCGFSGLLPDRGRLPHLFIFIHHCLPRSRRELRPGEGLVFAERSCSNIVGEQKANRR